MDHLHTDTHSHTQSTYDHAHLDAVPSSHDHAPPARHEDTSSNNSHDPSHLTTDMTMDSADQESQKQSRIPSEMHSEERNVGTTSEHTIADTPGQAKTRAVPAETAVSEPVHDSIAEKDQEWPLKSIYFPPFSETPSEVKILIQDQNGPCSFLALCNILLLRGDISLPLSLKSVNYSTLSTLLADYLLRITSSSSSSSPSSSSSLGFALNVLPKTLSGLDVNVDFINGTFVSSSDTSSNGGELELFNLANVAIKHGWMASRDDPETWSVLNEVAKDYDSAVGKMVDGDVVASESTGGNDADKQQTIYQASVIRRFLDTSSTQLTYAGLFHLSETLSPGSLSALFRNSHFSALYRRPDILPSSTSHNTTLPVLPQATLFHLVTDQALLYEPHAVWESLEDTDGAASRFFDGSLQPARIRGDYVARETKRSEERRREENLHDADMALAAQMQQDEYDREEYHRNQATASSQQATQQLAPAPTPTQAHQNATSSSISGGGGGHKPEDLHSKQLAGLGVKTRKEKEKNSNTTTGKDSGKKSKKDCIIC